MIPQSRPDLRASDFRHVAGIVRTRYAAPGPLVERLQEAFCGVVGTRYAAATSSGTAALHLGLLALGVGPGDEVLLPSYTCAAVYQAVVHTGALPRLIDVDPDTFNVTRETVRRGIRKRTRAVIVTHTFGFPAPVDELGVLGVPVVEDCATALGAGYRGRPVGSFGILSTFSMYATKMICAGEGGMVCTSDPRLMARLLDLNGVDRRDDLRPRYNYQLSDVAAGLGLAQLKRLPRFVTRRRRIARQYARALEGCRVGVQRAVPGAEPNYYRFVLRMPRAAAVLRAFREAGVWCDRPVFRPLHRYLSASHEDEFPGTERVFRSAVSVPIYPALTDRDAAVIAPRLRALLTDGRVERCRCEC